MEVTQRTIAGYRDKISVRPSETVNFKVSSFDQVSYQADLVRIISGNTRSGYTDLDLEEIPSEFEGRYSGRKQITECGSWGMLDPINVELISATLACAVMPTVSGRDDMTLISLRRAEDQAHISLIITSTGHLALRVIDQQGAYLHTHSLDTALPLRRWSCVGFSFDDATRTLNLFQFPLNQGVADPAQRAEQSCSFERVGFHLGVMESISFAAQDKGPNVKPRTACLFNGKLDSPRLAIGTLTPEDAKALVLAYQPADISSAVVPEKIIGFWDFAEDMGGSRIIDLSASGFDGSFKNLPTRAVTGVRWKGSEQRWVHAPEQYSAAHFHEYSLYDAEWETDFSYTVPEGLRSGLYAVRLRKDIENGSDEEFIVFFVLPGKGKTKAKVAFLAPTASYLAYCNERLMIPLGELTGAKPARIPEEQLLLDHPEFGFSMYDRHVDGLGVHFSSYLRPTINWRPGVRVWALTSDTDIIRWLEHSAHDYDVITDDALHQEGLDLLKDYQTVITGTHPEYYTQAMRDSVEAFVGQGGRLMYMGGNGFYWKVSHSDSWPAALELRRAEDGTRAWTSEPGEYYHQFDGELGGLWRRQGPEATPQQLVGVGFCATGDGSPLRFRKQPDAEDPRAAFILEGINGELICDYSAMGMSLEGAEELDRADPALGTPPHALVVASSENAQATMERAKEELLMNVPQLPDPDIRADVTFFETLGGGAVFSTGSIGWSTVLAYKGYDNNVARMCSNVLDRFVDPEPFTMPTHWYESDSLAPLVHKHPPGFGVEVLSWKTIVFSALKRAFITIGLSSLAKWKGFPIIPSPEPRDRLMARQYSNSDNKQD